MKYLVNKILDYIANIGRAYFFMLGVIGNILRGKIRVIEVCKQVYEQGYQSLFIVILASLASGIVLAMQGYVVLIRFGAKEFIAPLVALSLVRELSPVFTALIFSGKAGSRITAELGTMNVNDQILATRTLGVDPVEFLVVPRAIACVIVLPLLTVISEIAGVFGGLLVGAFFILYNLVIIAFYMINLHWKIDWWLQVSLHRILIALLPTFIFWSFYSLWCEK